MSIYIPIWLDYESSFSSFGCDNNYAFTFQYGQIMNDLEDLRGSICLAFTFQYGQIMN